MAMEMTAEATITSVISENGKVMIGIDSDSRYFLNYQEFDVKTMEGFSKVERIRKWTKSKTLWDMKGKKVRIIDNGEEREWLIAIGSVSRNKFIDIKGNEFAVSERRIYKRYGLLKRS